METDARLVGIVTALDGRISTVRVEGAGQVTLACEMRAALREKETRTSRLAVGDRVVVSSEAGAGGAGVIEEVLPRRTQLARGRGKGSREEHVIAANVDQLVVVAALRDPDWRPGFVDRMLCAAAKGGLAAVVVANKVDLVPPEERAAPEGGTGLLPDDLDVRGAPSEAGFRRDLAIYERLGYRVLETSGRSGEGVEALRAALAGKVSVVAGQSGVGKSTLLNALEPGLALRTQEVTRETRKGKHTTTGTTLIPLSFGGFVLDTPGVRSFGLFELDPREAGRLFAEIAAMAPMCKFNDCLHASEPECAVRAAVLRGEIDGRRYESYLRVLHSLEGEDDRG